MSTPHRQLLTIQPQQMQIINELANMHGLSVPQTIRYLLSLGIQASQPALATFRNMSHTMESMDQMASAMEAYQMEMDKAAETKLSHFEARQHAVAR